MTLDHKRIEKKWQRFWKDNKVFQSKIDHSKEKFYILDMFPYPSGAGLHVGHVTGYTGTDIIARFKRQKGFNVLHPIGWDSFGLPAEQYAIRTGTHPAVTTEKNIATYRRQLESLGFSYDWDREFATSDPKYYKWTQWIFSKLYEKGLAYEAEILVNFCPALGTVLANEEVEDGKAKEGGYPVERRPLRQWVLKITEYAERLISDLDLLDWPEHLKRHQINWIGKSKGAKIIFIEQVTHEPISIFTTRPDTLFGVTYLVLSPEHPLIKEIVTDDQRDLVEEYCQEAVRKSDLDRTDLSEEKTGVWTGSYVKHPITNKKIPIWVADYVLMGYGTGAVMAVPAHDERDFEFALKYKLPIQCVYDPDLTKEEEPFRVEYLQGKRCRTGDGKIINSEYEDFSLNGLSMDVGIEKAIDYIEKHNRGERTVTYKLRDWLFSRQRYWGEPIPILHFPDGTKRLLDFNELPLTPPLLEDYKPIGTGESPLAKAQDWVEITDPKTGKKARRETNTMPQWAGSCWYYLRFCDPHNDKQAWDLDAEKYWLPVDLYVGGIEHAVLHLLYARFWHKVLFDCGYVSTREPFSSLRNQGLVNARSFKKKSGGYVPETDIVEKQGKYFIAGTDEQVQSQIEKMSKSKLNGVSPDEIIEEFGADALRLYEMFMGPFDKEKIWNTDAVTGCKRFLNRFYDLVTNDKVTEVSSEEATKLGHRLVHNVTSSIEKLQFNVAIAQMMEFINAFASLEKYPKAVLKMATQMLYPFAPHLAEECWQLLGGKPSMAYEPLVEVDPKYLNDDITTYVVQINGKVRGRFEMPADIDEHALFEAAIKLPNIAKYLTGDVKKKIFVPNKLLNIVIGK